MKPGTYSALLLLVCAGGGRLGAQEAPKLEVSAVPVRGARAADFVPAGWKLAAQVEGDLNGDGRADRVLHLVPASSGYAADAVSSGPEASALVILLAERGALRRAGVAPRLLEVEMPQWGLHLSIRRGVLIVNQNYGMSDVWDLTDRVRLDVRSGRFILIGRDCFTYHRPQGMYDSVKQSDNLLTGQRLITTGHWGSGDRYWETNRRETIPRTRITFEDAAGEVCA